MQYSKLAVVVALASAVSAQTIADIPPCAITPTLGAIGSTGCATTDIACVCKNSGFLTSLQPLIQAACSASDYAKALQVAAALCAAAGVTITVPGGSSSAPASSAAATSAAASSAASSAAPSSAESSAAAITSSVVATVAPTTSAVAATTTPVVPKPSSNGTVTTSAKPPVVTANAAAVKGTWAAAGLLGVGAMLAAL